jgi:hypothetical protein
LFELLAKSKADVNFSYPEDSLNAPEGYRCSIMINIIRHCAVDMAQMRLNLQCLMEYGACLTIVDSNNCDVIMHSILQNNEPLVNFFVNNAATSMPTREFLRHNVDHEGKNAIHYIVNPHECGSFENVKILSDLAKSNIGYDLTHADKHGMKP